jgi:FlaA1/EpsC-like NDP-sugar epimerase
VSQLKSRKAKRMKRMLITGATGSLGGELVGRYYPHYEIYAHGRNADRLLRLRMRFPRLHIVLGDLRCHGLTEALRQCDVVIHAAAQKYVDLAEKHCYYTIDTNIVCTHELANLAARNGVERFVFISTDKSSAPSNVYGISKYLAERLILELADVYADTTFTICRFGNIFGSNGSVVRLWLDAAARNGVIQVTDPDMTRFMFSLAEAADTVDHALNRGQSGDILIPKMKAVCLRDLLRLFDQSRVEVKGKRPGEKLHETLYVKGEVGTGYETEHWYVLNRRATTRVQLENLDSAVAERVPFEQLQDWLGQARALAA